MKCLLYDCDQKHAFWSQMGFLKDGSKFYIKVFMWDEQSQKLDLVMCLWLFGCVIIYSFVEM